MTRGPLSDAALVRVLRALWSQRRMTPRNLAAAAQIAEAEVAAALDALQQRQCLIERSPQAIELIQTGLPCWRDIIEARGYSAPALGARGLPEEIARLGKVALIYQTTASTNDVCWQHAADPAAHGLVVLADQQSAGRGRRGDAWLANPGQSILMSILLRDHAAANLETLTLQLGLVTALALEAAAGVDCRIKWPNDVLLQDRKVAGVLVETRAGSLPDRQHVVLGIGINITQSSGDFPAALRPRATSLYHATGQLLDRLTVVTTLLDQIEALCLTPRPAEQWLPAWKARCPALGSPITARAAEGIFTGQLLDIDPFHGMVLLEPSGSCRFLSARTTTLEGRR